VISSSSPPLQRRPPSRIKHTHTKTLYIFSGCGHRHEAFSYTSVHVTQCSFKGTPSKPARNIPHQALFHTISRHYTFSSSNSAHSAHSWKSQSCTYRFPSHRIHSPTFHSQVTALNYVTTHPHYSQVSSSLDHATATQGPALRFTIHHSTTTVTPSALKFQHQFSTPLPLVNLFTYSTHESISHTNTHQVFHHHTHKNTKAYPGISFFLRRVIPFTHI